MPARGKGERTCMVHASGKGVVWHAVGWLCDSAEAGSVNFGLIGTLVKDQFDHGTIVLFLGPWTINGSNKNKIKIKTTIKYK